MLANSLDHYSLLRLTALAGGRRLKIPTFESLIQSFGVIVGVISVKRHNCTLNKSFRLVRSLLKDLDVPAIKYEHFVEAVEKVSTLVLNSMVKGEVESKSIFTQLRDSVAKLDEAADTCLLKAAQTDDPAMLLRIHEKITNTTQSLTSFIDSLFSEYIEENKR